MKRLFIYIIVFHILFIQSAYSGESTITKDDISVKKTVKSWIEFKNENLIRQRYDYSCGSASLATVLKYFFNENVTEREILESLLKKKWTGKKKALEIKDLALSFQDLKEYAEGKGYKAVGLALPMESLKELKVPAVVYVRVRDYEHFTVYKGMDDKFVYLADPSLGNIRLSIWRFREMFYTRGDVQYPGKVLVFIPNDNEKRKSVNTGFMKFQADAGLVYGIVKDRAVDVKVSP